MAGTVVTRPGRPVVHVGIPQSGPTWLALRRNRLDTADESVFGLRLGGSEAGRAIGMSPYKTPAAFYDHLIVHGDPAIPETPAMRKGHDREDDAARVYQALFGANVRAIEPGGYWEHADPRLRPFYGCSPDRLLYEEGTDGDITDPLACDGLLEIKCPDTTMKFDISRDHMAQVQFQLWITQAAFCDYTVVLFRNGPRDPYEPREVNPHGARVGARVDAVQVWRIPRSDEYINTFMVPRLRYFTRCCLEQRRPAPGLYVTTVPPEVLARGGECPAWARPREPPPYVESERLLIDERFDHVPLDETDPDDLFYLPNRPAYQRRVRE